MDAPEPGRGPVVRFFWGASGTGKSVAAYNRGIELDGAYWVPHTKGYHWYPDYDAAEHPLVIFDDFDSNEMTWHTFKRLINWTPCKVETKGGFVDWRPKEIIFTCNADPTSFWGDHLCSPNEQSVWDNRVTEVRKFERDSE